MPTLSELYGLDAPAPAAAPANQDGQMVSGFKRSFADLPGLAAGVGAYGADIIGADGVRDKLLAVAKKANDKEAQDHAGDAASLSDAWDGKSSWLDFVANSAGYVAGQALQSIATGGVGSVGMRMIAKSGAKDLAEKAAAKAIAGGASEQAAKVAAEKAAADAVKKASIQGAAVGAGAHNLGMELGSIYPDAVDQAHKEGRETDAGDLVRVGAAAATAAGVDTAAEGIMASRILRGTGASGGVLRRAATEIPGSMAREAGTEAAQTAIEHYGAGQPIADEAGMRDIIDSAGVGAVGGGLGGGAASLHAREHAPAEVAPQPTPSPGAAPTEQALAAGAPAETPHGGAIAFDPNAGQTFTFADGSVATGADAVIARRAQEAAAFRPAPAEEPTQIAGALPFDESSGQTYEHPDGSVSTGADAVAARRAEQNAAFRPAAPEQPTQVAGVLPFDRFSGQTFTHPDGSVSTGADAIAARNAAFRPGAAAAPTPGDLIRAQAVPDVGPLSRATNLGLEAAGAHVDAQVAEHAAQQQAIAAAAPAPKPIDPQQATALLDFANARANALETKAAGTKERKTPGPDGKPVVTPAVPKQFLTPQEQTEQTFLNEHGGDVQMLAKHYTPAPEAERAGPTASALASEPPAAPAAAPTPSAPISQPEPQAKERATVTGPDGDQRAVFSSEKAANAYLTEARRGQSSPLIASIKPVQLGDGTWSIGTPKEIDAAKSYELKMSPQGKPFAHRGQANAVAKKIGGEPVAVDGGFAVRKEVPREIREWQAFPPESGTLGTPRAEMPQIAAEHRGAMVNFLAARGITHEQTEVDPSTLKPTQAEFSPAKVLRAREFEGDADRSILISSDNHVLDGHHQWMAKLSTGEPVKVIRLDAPISKLVSEVHEFPSSTVADGATTTETTNAAVPAERALETQAPAAEGQPARGGARPAGGAGAEQPARARAAKVEADGVKTAAPVSKRAPAAQKAADARAARIAASENPEPPARARRAPASSAADEASRVEPEKSEPDAGLPFSRGGTGATSTASEERVRAIESFAGSITSRWANAPDVVVVKDMQDSRVPAAMRDKDATQKSQGAGGEPEGFFFGGKVYLVADQLPGDAAALRVLMHESLGHFGLRSVFGKELSTILDRMAVLQHGKVQTKAREYGLDMDKMSDRRAAAEEVLAEMAQTNPQLGWVKRAIAAIRSWLRDNVSGFDKLGFSDDELVRNFLEPARGWVKQGDQPTIQRALAGGAPAFSRSATVDDVRGTTVGRTLSNVVADVVSRPDGRNIFTRAWQHTVGTPYHMAQTVPEFKPVYDATQDYLHDVSAFAADSANLAPNVLPQMNTAKDFMRAQNLPEADAKALSRAVFDGTLMVTRDEDGHVIPAPDEMDAGSAGVVWTDDELRDRFKATDQQIALYRETRAAIDRSLDSMVASEVSRVIGQGLSPEMKAMVTGGDLGRFKGAVLSMLASRDASLLPTVQEMYDKVDGLKARGYAPLMRFGKNALYITKPNEHGEIEQVFFGMYESAPEANAAAREFGAQYPAGQGYKVERSDMSESAYQLYKGMTPETLELFARLTGTDKDEALQTYLKNAKASRSALKRLIHRKGVAGYSEKVDRVLAQFITSNARMSSANVHGPDMTSAAESIPAKLGDVKDMAAKLVAYVQNPAPEAQAIKGLLFAQYIGGSVASALVNMTQPLTMTLPYLAQFGTARAAARLASAMADATRLARGGTVADESLAAALSKAEKEGIVSPQEIHQLMGRASGKGSLLGSIAQAAHLPGKAVNVADGVGKRLSYAWGALFGLAEQFNRHATFIAAFKIAQEDKMADPFGFAAKAVADTQGTYNRGNRPQWARGAVGGALMTFKQFSISYLEFLSRLPRQQQLLALGVLMLTAGADGLPFADDLDDLIDTIGQRLGYATNAKRSKALILRTMLGGHTGMADFLEHGLSAVPGMPLDVSNRMSLGNLIPGTGVLKKSTTDSSKEWSEAVGPVGSAVQGAVNAFKQGSLGPMMPVALQNVAKAADMWQQGMYRNSAGQKVLDTSPADAITKAVGFQPAEVAREQRSMSVEKQSTDLAQVTKREILNSWAQALFDKDQAGVQAARQQLQQWNADNPEWKIAIGVPSVLQKVKAMRESKEDRTVRSTPKSMRATVRADLQD